MPFRSGSDPVLFLSNPRGVDEGLQRESLQAIAALNEHRLTEVGDPEIATRTRAFEMAGRMQSAAPELMDLSQETADTLAMYGAEPGKSSFANNCLLARRLVERGVRYVQLFHEAWDQHGNLVADLKKNCGHTDQGGAALIKDLKQRGLLDQTLVIWGGEFGRTPMVQGGSDGRDHHPNAFSMWLAGGGIKPGMTVGETDDLGFNIVRDRIHVRDLHATLLHLVGLDHERLTYKFQGLDAKLTGVEQATHRPAVAGIKRHSCRRAARCTVPCRFSGGNQRASTVGARWIEPRNAASSGPKSWPAADPRCRQPWPRIEC